MEMNEFPENLNQYRLIHDQSIEENKCMFTDIMDALGSSRNPIGE